MTKQLITINRRGGVQTLDFKKKGLSLQPLGKVSKERTSDIVWDESEQKWMIRFLHGTDANQIARYRHAADFDVPVVQGIELFGFPSEDLDDILYFDDYELAVSAEVCLIQSARKCGKGVRIAPTM